MSTPTEHLAEADPVGRAVAWLSAHPAVVAAFGAGARVTDDNEAPYPHLRVTDSSGDDRDLRWLIATDLTLEALADLNGHPGKSELKRLCRIATAALAELVEQPGRPVITEVRSTRGAGWVPEATGQGRYLTVVRLWSHP